MTSLALAGILFAQNGQPTSTSKWKVTILMMEQQMMPDRKTQPQTRRFGTYDPNVKPPKVLLTCALGSSFAGTVTHKNITGAMLWKQQGGIAQNITLTPLPKCQILGLTQNLQVGKLFQNHHYEAVVRRDGNSGFTVLNPKGASSSIAVGVSEGHPVGTSWIKGVKRAGMWSGTAASWIDLSPKGSARSEVRGAYGGNQYGCAEVSGGFESAGFWRKSPATWVNLNPKGCTGSVAEGGFGDYQVGSAQFGKTLMAGYWRGTAKSWVRLAPAAATSSSATGAWRTFQVGMVSSTEGTRPCVWEGSASSIVYLDSLTRSLQKLAPKVYITGDEKNTYIYGCLQGESYSLDRVVVFTRSNSN